MAVSVIIPTYNAEKYIAQTINSVLSQTYQDFEIIIVDDGSVDSTANIVKSFNNPKIKYLYQNNSGPAIARNKGIDIAKGEYIAFLDADDIWKPDKLEVQIREIEKSPDIGLVYSWVKYIDSDGNAIGKSKYNITDKFYENLILGNYVDDGSVPLVRRECFDKVGKFNDMHWSEDWDMWIRISKEYKFALIRDYLVKYRVHPDGISRNYKNMEIKLFEILDREFQNPNENIAGLKSKAYSYRYIYLSGVCRHLMEYKDAYDYALKAVKINPLILTEKTRLKEILKLLIIMSIPKIWFRPMRKAVKSILVKVL